MCYVAVCSCIRSADLQSSKSPTKRFILSKREGRSRLGWNTSLKRPHMSTSQCGNICVMPPKCSRKERKRGFSNHRSVDAAMSRRRCVFLCESKSTLFGLQKVDAIRNHSFKLFTTEQHNPNVRICVTHFMNDQFVNLGQYKAGYTQRLFLKKKKIRLCYDNLALLNQRR